MRQTTSMLVVAEPEDEASGFIAMGAQGVVYRSIDGPTIVDAVRLAYDKTYVHTPNSGITEIGEDKSVRGYRSTSEKIFPHHYRLSPGL